MSITNPAVKPIVSAIVQSIVQAPSVVQRYFTDLASAGSQHYTIPSITLSGDFILEIDFVWDGSSFKTLLGELADTSYIRIQDATSVQFKLAGVFQTFTITTPASKLITAVITRTGTTVTLDYSDGASASVNYPTADNLTLDRIGVRGTTNYFNDIIANVKITDAGVLKRHYPIDESWSLSTVLNDISGNAQHGTAVNITSADAELFTQTVDLDWLGQELWSDPPSFIGTQWTDNGGGEYTYTGDGTFNQLAESMALISGNSYRVTLEVTSVSGTMKVFTSSTLGTFNSTGKVIIQGVADSVLLGFARNSGTVSCTIRDISARRLLEVA